MNSYSLAKNVANVKNVGGAI